MTDDKGAGEGQAKREPLRMNAYYYAFSSTGCYEVDRILSAVACAGKAFHNTDCWTDECAPYDGHVGDTPAGWIQNAANDCAAVFKTIYEASRKAERERCLNVLKKYPDDGKELGDILEAIRLEIKGLI